VAEEVKRVVLEYEVVAYHPPEDFFEQMLTSRARGRYAPTWREVWVCSLGATPQGNT
jgi:hypothetical protein